jgi:hypothetical protein
VLSFASQKGECALYSQNPFVDKCVAASSENRTDTFYLFIFYRRRNNGGELSNLCTSSNGVTVKLVSKDGEIQLDRV